MPGLAAAAGIAVTAADLGALFGLRTTFAALLAREASGAAARPVPGRHAQSVARRNEAT
ncbi:hypothetical protein ACIA5G_22815 [Amycolatopsis sp. NPDC051758]|uniref:hypothetical protein n=1 Tax=Amycolatopsis sp. NPDC051758 TaxID=3363935 RepID=UPI0037BAC023